MHGLICATPTLALFIKMLQDDGYVSETFQTTSICLTLHEMARLFGLSAPARKIATARRKRFNALLCHALALKLYSEPKGGHATESLHRKHFALRMLASPGAAGASKFHISINFSWRCTRRH